MRKTESLQAAPREIENETLSRSTRLPLPYLSTARSLKRKTCSGERHKRCYGIGGDLLASASDRTSTEGKRRQLFCSEIMYCNSDSTFRPFDSQ